MSRPEHEVGSRPSRITRMLDGCLSQVVPVANANKTSVEPIPVAQAPTAPAMTVWLSAPMMSEPG